jgi:hypothetical protein
MQKSSSPLRRGQVVRLVPTDRHRRLDMVVVEILLALQTTAHRHLVPFHLHISQPASQARLLQHHRAAEAIDAGRLPARVLSHYEHVRSVVPADRLLEFHIANGCGARTLEHPTSDA